MGENSRQLSQKGRTLNTFCNFYRFPIFITRQRNHDLGCNKVDKHQTQPVKEDVPPFEKEGRDIGMNRMPDADQ